MDIIKKYRLNYTISLVALAAVFLFIIFAALLGIGIANNMSQEKAALVDALSDKPLINNSCLIFYDGAINEQSSNASYYGDDLEDIKNLAIETKNGRFKYGSYYFAVESIEIMNSTKYAVYDCTSNRKEIIDRSLQSTLLYCLSVIIFGIIAYLISSKAVQPVSDAFSKQKDLMANASHELKTPLTIISANLDVIKSEPQSNVSDNDKELNTISEQITRMQGLIQSMLELSKLEQIETAKNDVNLSEIIEGACLSYEAVCFEKGTTLISEITPDIIISGDQNSLERLIIILLDNANKYCGNNGKIGIKLSQEVKRCHLTVMNTGDVINEEEAKHVFDRFYRTDGARENKDNQSFGLGLSIAHTIVLNHGGTITCHGVENKGTVFDIKLPIKKLKN